MKITLCRANCLGNAENCYYPHQRVVTDEETLIEAVSRDYETLIAGALTSRKATVLSWM